MIIGSEQMKSSFQNQLRTSTNLILTNSNFEEEGRYIYTRMVIYMKNYNCFFVWI